MCKLPRISDDLQNSPKLPPPRELPERNTPHSKKHNIPLISLWTQPGFVCYNPGLRSGKVQGRLAQLVEQLTLNQ